MATQVVFVAGDIHGFWHLLNEYIDEFIRNSEQFKEVIAEYEDDSRNVEVIILQCGDFGIWSEDELNNLPIDNEVDFIKDGYVKIYFADGNHENHDLLDKLEAENPNKPFIAIAMHIYFATFGSILQLIDGTKVLFCGGAEISNKKDRTEGLDWWPQEGIDDKDMLRLPPAETKIDWIISHALPSTLQFRKCFGEVWAHKLGQLSQDQLKIIYENFKPSRWYFGHYHHFIPVEYEECKFKGLADSTYRVVHAWTSLEAIIKK